MIQPASFNFQVIAILISFLTYSCMTQEKEERPANTIEGTWELVSETKIERGDTTFTPASKDQRMLKIINKTHFAFLRHDLTKGKDSTAMFVAGGGTYSLQDDQYSENLEFCNFREWEDHAFDFKIDIRNDTLIQTGKEKVEELGIERIIVEKYRKV